MSNDRSNTIAVFLPSLAGGGAEKVVVNLVNEFISKNIKVDLILGKGEGPLLKKLNSKVRIIDLDRDRIITCLPKLIVYLLKNRPAAIFSAMDHANVVAVFAKIISRVETRVVISVHTNLKERFLKNRSLFNRLFVYSIKMAYKMADAIVAVSEGGASDVASVANLSIESVSVIYNPVLTNEFFTQKSSVSEVDTNLIDSRPLVLAVGRLVKEKDYPTLLEAFFIVQAKLPAQLVILGEGGQRSHLESIIMRKGLAEKVLLPGFVDNPVAYMEKATVFVLSSVVEGFGNVLVEAMACGTPIISTDCPTGPREIVSKNDVLVPVGDSLRMAEEIVNVLEKPVKRYHSEKSLEKFDSKIIAEKYLKLIFANSQKSNE